MTKPPPTPELDKRHEVIASGENDTLTRFVDWLEDQRIVFAKWVDDHEQEELVLVSFRPDYNRLFAEFFGLDPDVIAAEQDALLAHIRSAPACGHPEPDCVEHKGACD